MDRTEIEREINRLGPWHHDVEVIEGVRTMRAPMAPANPDLRTPTTYRPVDHFKYVAGSLFPSGFDGRSFLDCACNGGGHTLAAARLGAGRCFAFDAREQWIEQARFLKKFAPHEQIDLAVATLDDLPALAKSRFDVTFFGGIFYHLPDPITGLKIAADLTEEILILNTAAKWAPGKVLAIERESPDEAMSGVDGLAWLPSGPEVLRDLLGWCGFPHTRLSFHRPTDEGWSRLEIFAARDAASFAHFDRVRKEAKALTGPSKAKGRFSRVAERLKDRLATRRSVAVPGNMLDMLLSAECRAWTAEHCEHPFEGRQGPDGEIVLLFGRKREAEAFRRRWLG